MSAFTPAELEHRRSGVGSSEVSAILGVSPWRDALSVFAEKTGREPPFAGNFATAVGTALEPVIADRWARLYGYEIAPVTRRTLASWGFEGAMISAPEGDPADLDRPVTLRHPDHEWARASIDRVVLRDGRPWRPLEIKHVGERGAEDWPPVGGEVPEQHQPQVAWQLGIGRALGLFAEDSAEIACGISNREIRGYTLRCDDALFRLIFDAVAEFRERHLLTGIPPEPRSAEAMARYVAMLFPAARDKTKLAATPEFDAMAARCAEARAVLARAQAGVDEADVAIKRAIGDAYGVKGGAYTASYYNTAGRSATTWRAVLNELTTAWELALVATQAGAPIVKPDAEAIIARHTTVGAPGRVLKLSWLS